MDTNIKVRFSVEFDMSKLNFSNEKFYVNTSTKIFLLGDNKSNFYRNKCRELLDKIKTLECKGSGWHVQRINKLFMSQAKYLEYGGSSYLKLKEWIALKHVIINIKNYDNECFKWSILAHLYPVKKDSQRVSKYHQYKDELNFEGINFPVKLSDISKFEKLNKMSINVLASRGKEIFSIHKSKQTDIPIKKNKFLKILN